MKYVMAAQLMLLVLAMLTLIYGILAAVSAADSGNTGSFIMWLAVIFVSAGVASATTA